MKVMGVGNKESFFSSLKIFLNIGWFFGIFPVKFDGTLYSFRYKFLSFTTILSFVRLTFIILLFLLPNLVVDTVDFVAKNSTDQSLNKTSYFTGERDILKNTSDYLLERVELFVVILNALALLVIPAAICSDLGTAMTELATSSYRKTLRGKSTISIAKIPWKLILTN